MKNLFAALFVILALQLQAQPLVGSFTDCNNRTESIQATLGTGKAIIVAHKGVDCSICQSQAPGLQSWAAQNKTKVDVWCALTWKYNSNTFSPACTATQNWISNYSWNDIFTFPDNGRQFINFATPRYYVYSPVDSSIVYSGSNRNTAYSMALQASIVGLEDQQLKEDIKWTVIDRQLSINNGSGNILDLFIYDLNGRLITERNLVNGESNIDLSELKSSVYLVNFRSSTSSFSEKVLIQ